MWMTVRPMELLKFLMNFPKKFVKALSFSKNFGHQAALSAGLRIAEGDAVISLDADLQDPPELIENMLICYRDGFEIVYGVRNNREEDTFLNEFQQRVCVYVLDYFAANIPILVSCQFFQSRNRRFFVFGYKRAHNPILILRQFCQQRSPRFLE